MKNNRYVNIFLIAVILVSSLYTTSKLFRKAKIDFTEENIYTLSDGTKNVLGKLTTPVTIKLFYSKTAANKGSEGVRYFNNYFFYVKDLLEEYVSYSRNNLKLEIIDPRPDTPEEEDAIRANLKQFPLSETEKYFFGLVARNASGVEKVIEFFDPSKSESLEYDLTKLIYSTMDAKKKVVGIFSPLKIINGEMSPYMMQMMMMQGQKPPRSWIIADMMKEFYEIKNVDLKNGKVENVDILVVVHPKNLSNSEEIAIDQFVVNGGRLLVLVDPFFTTEERQNNPAGGQNGGGIVGSDLPELFKKWGVEYRKDQFLGDPILARAGRISQFAPPQRLLPLIGCDQRCLTSKDAISAGMKDLVFLFPGGFKIASNFDKDNLKHFSLVTTTEKGNFYQASPYELQDSEGLFARFKEGEMPIDFAIKLSGKFSSAFSSGVATLKGEKDAAVILIADVDFISNNYAFSESFFGISAINNNSGLFLNALENLAGSSDLMSIRSKSRINRTFDVVDEIELDARKKTENKVNQINAQIAHFSAELEKIGRDVRDNNMSNARMNSSSSSNLNPNSADRKSGSPDSSINEAMAKSALLQNKGVEEKKKLAKKVAELKAELREVKREGREKIESLGKILQYINTLLVPIIVLFIGLVVGYLDYKRRQVKIYKDIKITVVKN